MTDMPLHKLLSICSDRNSPGWERGWRLFLLRYKMPIYRAVTRRCSTWNVPRLRRQLSETVNDIVAEVLMLLLNSLSDFRAVDDEGKFYYWLMTICNRAASRYLQKQFVAAASDVDVGDLHYFLQGVRPADRWELYEQLNRAARSTARKKSQIERNTHIFFLYTWADFSADMIARHPCLTGLGHRVVDNVVNRLRDSLKNQENLE